VEFRKGYTLIEMIIVMTLAVIVLTMVFTISIAVMNTRNRFQVRNDAIYVVHTLADKLRDEFTFATDIHLSPSGTFLPGYSESFWLNDRYIVNNTGAGIILNASYGSVGVRYDVLLSDPSDNRMQIDIFAVHGGNDVYRTSIFIENINLAINAGSILYSNFTPGTSTFVNPSINFNSPV